MSLERKRHFIEELKRHYRDVIAGARDAEVGTGDAAETLKREARSREDAKGAAEFGRMSVQHRERRERAKHEVDRLVRFAESELSAAPQRQVGLGALVDVSIEDEDGGEVEERTLFVLPVGAGTELHGPGGDGFLSVVTPQSPVGRALMGAAAGDDLEIAIAGREREWSVIDVC